MAEQTQKKLSLAAVVPLPLKEIVVPQPQKPELRPQQRRRRILAASFFLAVVLPGFLVSLFFLQIASDRYASSTSFTVRSMESTAVGTDLLSAFTGSSSSGSTGTDSFIILNFLKSRELVELLREEFDLQQIYSNDAADFFYRMEKDLTIEKLVEYWESMIITSYDRTSSIISFEIQAFSPHDAEKLTTAVVGHAQTLINNLSRKAREDSVRFAKKEVASAELRLKLNRQELRDYRALTSAIDPIAEATAQVQIETELEREIITIRAQLAGLLASLQPDAPSVIRLKQQIAALEGQLDEKRSIVSRSIIDQTGTRESLSSVIANFERLSVDREFAQQAYTLSLASLERARVEADRQQRFLAIFSPPAMPEDAIYPERILNSIIGTVFAFLIWGMGVLIVYSVRDHLK